MGNKRFLGLLLMILIGLITVSAVGAADASDDIVSLDETTNEVADIENTNANAEAFTSDASVSSADLKMNTTIESDVLVDGNDVSLTVDVNPDATGLVKFTLNENSVYADVNGGRAVYNTVLIPGDYTFNATYMGDDNFNMNATSQAFSVVEPAKMNTSIKAVASVLSHTVTVNVNVDERATGYVTIGVLGQRFLIPVNGGKAVFKYDFDPGSYEADVDYLGDDNFNNASTTVPFTVIKDAIFPKDTPISADVETSDNGVKVTADIDPAAYGLIEFNIDGDVTYIIVDNGKAVYETVLPAGDYNITVTYLGDELSKFNPNQTSVAFTVTDHVKKNTTVTPEVTVDGYDVALAVAVDENATGLVKLELEGNTIFVELNEGKAIFSTIMLPGNYTASATYMGDDDFNANATDFEFEVGEIPLNNTNVTLAVEIDENYVEMIVGVDENATGLVEYCISGAEEFTSYVALDDGIAVLKTFLEPGDYEVLATYLGNDSFYANSTSQKFTVIGHIKKDTSIKVTSDVQSSTVTIEVDVDRNATGYVTISVLGESFIVPVNDGKAVLSYPFIPGTYTAKVVYLGDDDFNNATARTSFTVIKEDTHMMDTPISVDVVSNDNDVTITATVDSAASGLVEFNVAGDAAYVSLDNGETVYETVLPAGDYVVRVTYSGDSRFNANKTSKEFTVTDHVKMNTTIASEVAVDGYDVNLTIDVDANATGLVKLEIDGNAIFVELNEGKASFNAVLWPGNYTVNAEYLGNEEFNANSTEFTIAVDEIRASKIRAVIVDNDLNITFALKDENGEAIADAPIFYILNGTQMTTSTDEEGLFTINAGNTAEIYIEYGGSKTIVGTEMAIKIDLPAIVPPVKTQTRFNITNNSITLKGYAIDKKAGEKGMTYFTQLLDIDGNPISNATIQFAINDKIHTRVTDENGSFAPYELNMNRAGRFTLAFSFGGDDSYLSAFAVVCVDLDKKPITLEASSASYRVSTKTKLYTAKLSTIAGSSADGNVYMSPKKVTLKVNGKTFTGTTNEDGEVTFKITNLSKRGKFTAVVSYEGDSAYESASKSVTLTVN